MLSAKDAFKVGFLSRCVEDGVPFEQIEARVKQAEDLLEKRAVLGSLLGTVADAGKGLAGGIAHYGVPLALAAPPLLGGAIGYGLGKATDVDETDVDDIKNQEVVDEYRRQTDKLQRLKAVRDYMKQRQRTGRVFM